MGCEAAIGGAHGPAIAGQDRFAGAAGDDGLDGDDQAFGEEIVGGRIGPVGHAGFLVDGAADAVAAEVANDVETGGIDFFFDDAADVADAMAGARDLHRLSEGALGADGKTAADGGLCDGRSDDDRFRRVGHEAVLRNGHVELEQVAIAETAVRGDAVDDFVVNADAADAGKLVNGNGSGNGAVLAHDVATDLVEFHGGDAGTGGGFHGLEHEPDDVSGFAHGGEFFGGVDGQRTYLLLLFSQVRMPCGEFVWEAGINSRACAWVLLPAASLRGEGRSCGFDSLYPVCATMRSHRRRVGR